MYTCCIIHSLKTFWGKYTADAYLLEWFSHTSSAGLFLMITAVDAQAVQTPLFQRISPFFTLKIHMLHFVFSWNEKQWHWRITSFKVSPHPSLLIFFYFPRRHVHEVLYTFFIGILCMSSEIEKSSSCVCHACMCESEWVEKYMVSKGWVSKWSRIFHQFPINLLLVFSHSPYYTSLFSLATMNGTWGKYVRSKFRILLPPNTHVYYIMHLHPN